jgi:transposase
MPWKECNQMDERLKFVGRLLDGDNMTSVCREFGVARKTGYKIFNRYKDCGLDGLQDQNRRPYRQANRLPFQVERTILQIKREKPTWGAPKIRERLIRKYPGIKTPAKSTVHAVLERHGMVTPRKARRYRAQGTDLSEGKSPNELWCADYKGEFQLGDHRYCYPLTVTDYRSRYLLACEGLESTKAKFAFTVLERVFKEFGLPLAIRTDNVLTALSRVVLRQHDPVAVASMPHPCDRRVVSTDCGSSLSP